MPPPLRDFHRGLHFGLAVVRAESVYTFRFGRGGSNPRSREFLVTAEVALSTLRLAIGGLLAMSIRLREVLIK